MPSLREERFDLRSAGARLLDVKFDDLSKSFEGLRPNDLSVFLLSFVRRGPRADSLSVSSLLHTPRPPKSASSPEEKGGETLAVATMLAVKTPTSSLTGAYQSFLAALFNPRVVP